MNQLKLVIEDSTDFDQLCSVIQSSSILNCTKDFLKSNECVVNNREFLISLLIYKFPKDVMGNISDYNDEGISISRTTLDNTLETKAKELVNYTFNNLDNIDKQAFNILANNFASTFNDWKKDDFVSLANSMFYCYHALTVDILNADEEIKPMLQVCQDNIIREALKLGGEDLVQEIKDFAPVVIDKEALLETYSKAFWDLLAEDHTNGDYEKIFAVLEHIKSMLISLNPSQRNGDNYSEVIDVEFIRGMVSRGVYGPTEILNLQKAIAKFVENVQSPDYDDLTKVIREKLDANCISLPEFLKDIAMILQMTCDDLLQLRTRMEQQSSS